VTRVFAGYDFRLARETKALEGLILAVTVVSTPKQ
jgi:hypothetical protein